jgi:hypothetical protein
MERERERDVLAHVHVLINIHNVRSTWVETHIEENSEKEERKRRERKKSKWETVRHNKRKFNFLHKINVIDLTKNSLNNKRAIQQSY